jgi:hypothetical protein
MEALSSEHPDIRVPLIVREDDDDVRELAALRSASGGGEPGGKAGGQGKKCQRQQ